MKQKKKAQKSSKPSAKVQDLPPEEDPRGGTGFLGGVYVAAGDVSGDGVPTTPKKITR